MHGGQHGQLRQLDCRGKIVARDDGIAMPGVTDACAELVDALVHDSSLVQLVPLLLENVSGVGLERSMKVPHEAFPCGHLREPHHHVLWPGVARVMVRIFRVGDLAGRNLLKTAVPNHLFPKVRGAAPDARGNRGFACKQQ